MFKNLKSEFGGSTLWMFLMLLGGYIPVVLIAISKTEEQKVKNEALALPITIIYFIVIMFSALLTFFSKYRKATKSLVIRNNITTSPNTEELDVVFLVEYYVDLDITVDIDVSKYDDFAKYGKRIIETIKKIAAEKADFLSMKLKLKREGEKFNKKDKTKKKDNEKNEKNEESLEIEKYTSNQLSKWLNEEFKASTDLNLRDKKGKRTIYVSWVKLVDEIIPEATPDLIYDKCIIISPRPFLDQFPFQTRDEIIDEYWIDCKATRSEMIQLDSIHSKLPVFLSNHTPADNITPIKVALDASTMKTVEGRTMKHIIASERMEFNNYYVMKNEKDDLIREKDENIARLTGVVKQLQSVSLKRVLKPEITKKNNGLIALLSIVSCIFFMLYLSKF